MRGVFYNKKPGFYEICYIPQRLSALENVEGKGNFVRFIHFFLDILRLFIYYMQIIKLCEVKNESFKFFEIS